MHRYGDESSLRLLFMQGASRGFSKVKNREIQSVRVFLLFVLFHGFSVLSRLFTLCSVMAAVSAAVITLFVGHLFFFF